MKRLPITIASLTLAAAMCVTAGAANVGTIDNNYPGDTEAQAQMLCDLGLFKGTDKGFELEKPMTRAQAAVMLTRLLGSEKTALSENNPHPFNDVPEWASPYVGWLYRNGLTKGMSETEYGSSRNITCEQYSTFLTRAVQDLNEFGEEYLVIGENEYVPCDLNGFVRGDAVSLSTRILEEIYTKNNNSDGTSVALHLIEQGVFTKDQLKDAAWDVLPRKYEFAGERNAYEEQDRKFSCIIAGVPVIQNADVKDISPVWFEKKSAQPYCYSKMENGSYKLYRIDPDTLEPTLIKEYPNDYMVDLIAVVGNTDYLSVESYSGDEIFTIAVNGSEVTELELSPRDNMVYGDNGLYAFDVGNAAESGKIGDICVLDDKGPHTISQPTVNSKVCLVAYGHIITQDITAEQTVITSLDPDGTVKSSVTVKNEVTSDDVSDNNLDYWLSTYAPNIDGYKEGYIYGSAGLFSFKYGVIKQVTSRGVYDFKTDPSDNSIVAIATEPSERRSFSGAGISYISAANEVIRISAEGNETVLLSGTPDHGLNLTKVSYADKGKVRVVHEFIMGMSDWHAYEYEVENGRPRPIVHIPGSGYSGYTKEECELEQARIEAVYNDKIGTIDNNYPGNVKTQAKFLTDIGLFEDTYDNTLLERSITREAAAMMKVVLLGKAKEAKEENNSHPFTDVRSWASPYVGWLCKHGLDEGISESMYGADSNETCAQFCKSLTLMVRDSAEPSVFPAEEISACDTNGFLRADAVSLMTQLLNTEYKKDGCSDGKTLAQHLADEGVFAQEEFEKAVKNVHMQ